MAPWQIGPGITSPLIDYNYGISYDSWTQFSANHVGFVYALELRESLKNSYNDVKKGAKSNKPLETKGISDLFNLWQTTIIRYLQFKDIAKWAKEITETTKEQIQSFRSCIQGWKK